MLQEKNMMKKGPFPQAKVLRSLKKGGGGKTSLSFDVLPVTRQCPPLPSKSNGRQPISRGGVGGAKADFTVYVVLRFLRKKSSRLNHPEHFERHRYLSLWWRRVDEEQEGLGN